MNNTFAREEIVRYSDISANGKLDPAAAVNFFQSLAVAHSDAVGLPVSELRRRSIGWIVLNWHLTFFRLPAEGESLSMHTWAEPYRHAQSNRDFCICDKDGNECIAATSRWVLMDTERRRPSKLSREIIPMYEIENGRKCAEGDYSFDMPEDLAPTQISTFSVGRRDTDTNGHANNASYVSWALDLVPDEIYDACDIKELKVSYKKEARRGTQVLAESVCSGTEAFCVFKDANAPEKVFCSVYSAWESSSSAMRATSG